MLLNSDKTKVIHFGAQPGDKRLSIKMGSKDIEQKDSVRYLGVILDSQLKFEAQIEAASGKVLLCQR